MNQEHSLLEVRAAAERLAVSQAMVYNLVNQGELPCVRIGVSIRIPANGVEAFIASHSQLVK